MPTVDPWLPLPPGPAPAHPVFCLPYAGGSSATYRSWRRHAPAGLTIVPVQPPGRRERLDEPALTSAVAMAEQAAAAMLPVLRGPYSLFGISMGALVAFELAHHLSARQCADDTARLVLAAARRTRKKIKTKARKNRPDRGAKTGAPTPRLPPTISAARRELNGHRSGYLPGGADRPHP